MSDSAARSVDNAHNRKRIDYGSVYYKNEAGDSLLFWGFFVFLTTFVIEGPLRYALVQSGFPNAIYLRDVLEVVCVAFIFLRSLLKRGWIEPYIAVVFCALIFHLLLALLFGRSLFQSLFGFKVFLPFVYGVSVWPILSSRFLGFIRVLTAFFLVSIIGVFINYLLQKMPWEGKSYVSAFGALETTREWTTGYAGTKRLPGFARASYDAATYIGISGFAYMLSLKNTFSRLLVAACALLAISFTTTKGMTQAFIIITIWMLFKNKSILFPFARLLIVTFFFLAVALPTVAVFFDLGKGIMMRDVPTMLTSLWERFTWMWPAAFNLLPGPENYIIGNGLGSIGVPQTLNEDHRQLNAADNIFVYAFINFGLLSLAYLGYVVKSSLESFDHSQEDIWGLGILIFAFSFGLTTNMFEGPFFCALFGLVFSQAMNRKHTRAIDL